MSLGPDPGALAEDPAAGKPVAGGTAVEAEPDPAEIVAAAVLGCPSVAALADDGSVATFLPGRRVHGVARTGEGWTVEVVLHWDGSTPLPELADLVRRAAAPVVGDSRIDIVVAGLLEAGLLASSEPEPAAP